jgi:phage/plasmid-associated DNA primase
MYPRMNLGASELMACPCGEMYQSYVAWCNQNGFHPLNASNFGKEVKTDVSEHCEKAHKTCEQTILDISGVSSQRRFRSL